MAITIGESVSRVRNVLKAVKEDPFLTDRFLHSLLIKYAKTLIKRESKKENLYKYTHLFQEIPCVDLIEVDKVDACCIDIKTGCTIMRTKEKLPKLLDIDSGPVIRSVSSVDYSKRATQTYPELYTNLTRTSGFRYNKNKYFWFLDGHLYLPDVNWEGVRIQAIFDSDITGALCNIDSKECVPEQDRELSIPEHLFSEMEQMVIQEILTSGQIPSDGPDDSQNVMR